MNNLKFCSFIGIDEKTPLRLLDGLQHVSEIPLEFGLLYSHNKSGKHNRYPNLQFFDKFKKESTVNSAIHLCGSSVDDFLKNSEFINRLCDGFNRIQLNFKTTDYNELELTEYLSNHINNGYKLIIQYNDTNKSFIHNTNLNFDILFDNSGGLGKQLTSPLPVLNNHLCGYAGGITPLNVVDIVDSINSVNINSTYYIDMESGIRDNNDWFDINKCIEVVTNLTEK